MYGERRQRNIILLREDKTSPKQQQHTDEDDWYEEEVELEEGYEEEEDEQGETRPDLYLIDGKPFVLKQQAKKPTFQESHTRITTYLENNIFSIIKILQDQNQIDSITSFINNSVKYYLMEKFQDRRNQ